MGCRASRSPESCWIVFAARSVLWFFVSVNVGVLFGVIVAAIFGPVALGLHAILLLSILMSLASVGLWVRGS